MNSTKKSIIKLVPIILLCSVAYVVFNIVSKKENFNTSTEGVDEDDIKNRTMNRGTLVSVLSSIMLALVGGVMAQRNVPDSMIVLNFGFILAPVIGYMLDIGIGTDEGYGLFDNKKEWVYFVLESMVSAKFLRYIITILLDIFISDPIQDVVRYFTSGLRLTLMNTKNDTYLSMIGKNFPSILQSVIAFITFNAYTNQTRFKWAYPNQCLPKDKRINTFTISIATSIAAMGFLTHNYHSKSSDLSTKLIYVVLAIGLLYVLNQFELGDTTPYADCSNKKELDDDTGDNGELLDDNTIVNLPTTTSTSTNKVMIGGTLFALFVSYGLVYPLSKTK